MSASVQKSFFDSYVVDLSDKWDKGLRFYNLKKKKPLLWARPNGLILEDDVVIVHP